MKFTVAVLLSLAAFAASASVDSQIDSALAKDGSVTVIVSMANSRTPDLVSAFKSKRFSSRGARLNAFYSTLKIHADEVQADVLSVLANAKAANPELRVDQLWVSNQIILREANAATIDLLRNRADVQEMHKSKEIPLLAPQDLRILTAEEVKADEPQWGVKRIEADLVHLTGNRGQGAVIANIDTGVRYTHVALRDGWRQEYGWYDPARKTTEPNDGQGHGTHTMGTIAGRANGIGVAPEAQWIACKGCGAISCTEADLLACGQWVTCPTDTQGENLNCDMAPHTSSNSWGGGQDDPFYRPIIQAWRAAGIVPLFASGNSGPFCGTVNSPSDDPDAISIGSTGNADGVSIFTSIGPPLNSDLIKPDVSAPGYQIVSAFNTGDEAYSALSGTSMACPHAAGLTGLMYTANPNLTVDQIQDIMQSTANGHVPSGKNCGGIEETIYPNHVVGHGIIDAVNAVRAAAELGKQQ